VHCVKARYLTSPSLMAIQGTTPPSATRRSLPWKKGLVGCSSVFWGQFCCMHSTTVQLTNSSRADWAQTKHN